MTVTTATPRPITPAEYCTVLEHLYRTYPDQQYTHLTHGLSRYLPCIYQFTIPAYGSEVRLSLNLGSDAPLNRGGTTASVYCNDQDAVLFLPLTTRTTTDHLVDMIDDALYRVTHGLTLEDAA